MIFELCFWIINLSHRIPNYKSLFECLFRRIPNYNFLCTFGCLCFPFLCPYHAHKLDFRSSPCVFLGYSSSHLGYHCLDLAYHCIYVSRHVCFHENVFPFANSEQITHTPVPSTQPTHLPSLHPPNSFSLPHYQPTQTAPLFYPLPHSNRPLTCP
jgi:histone deacetylase 1/2